MKQNDFESACADIAAIVAADQLRARLESAPVSLRGRVDASGGECAVTCERVSVAPQHRPDFRHGIITDN